MRGQGRPVLGKVRIDESFGKLKPGQIYDYDPDLVKKTEADKHVSHALVFLNKRRSTAMSFKKKSNCYITRRSGYHHTNKPQT
jgi:hypothetical protein